MRTSLIKKVFGAIVIVLIGSSAQIALAADWVDAPSFFSHDPDTGNRVRQYTPIGPVYNYNSSNYVRSGFRHSRSSIQVGDSADHLVIVEEWGRPVRPFGEWRYPYRPYSAPYDAWGPPFGGLGHNGVGRGGFGGGYGPGYPGGVAYGPGYVGRGPRGFGPFQETPAGGFFGADGFRFGAPGRAAGPPQWTDGHYPSYGGRDGFSHGAGRRPFPRRFPLPTPDAPDDDEA